MDTLITRSRPASAIEFIKKYTLLNYGLTVTSVKEMGGYFDRNYWIQVDQQYTNTHIKEVWPHGYTVKVINSTDSKTKHSDAEMEMAIFLKNNGIECPQPVLTIDGQLKKIATSGSENCSCICEENVIFLLTFIPGQLLCDVQYSSKIIFQTGVLVGRITRAIQEFSHPELASYHTIWNLKNLHKLPKYLHIIDNDNYQNLVKSIVREFEKTVLPNLHKCSKAVIHGDLNPRNILVRQSGCTEDEEYEVQAVIDFGDSSESYVVFDIAILIMHLMITAKDDIDPLEIPFHILSGFSKYYEMNSTEKNVLKVLIAGRFCQVLVLEAHANSEDPENDFISYCDHESWVILEKLWNSSNKHL